MRSENGYQGNDEEGFEQTSRNDPRVTKLGKILRQYSIDELHLLRTVAWSPGDNIAEQLNELGARAWQVEAVSKRLSDALAEQNPEGNPAS